MPSKKDSCNLIHHGVAGATPDQILETIRAEYWLPARAERPPATGAADDVPQPDETNRDESKSTQVKP